MTRRLALRAAPLLASNLGGGALSFIIAILIGRSLGERGLGVYALALAWVVPLSLLVEFGLGTLLTREIAISPASTPALLRGAAALRLLMGAPVMGALLVGAPLLTPDATAAAGLRVSAPLVIILPFYGTFTAVLRAHGRMTPIPFLNIGMLAAQAALTALIVPSGGAVMALSINTVTSAGQLIAAWWICRAFTNQLDTGAPPVRDLLRRSAPFAAAAVLAALQLRLPVIMLEQMAAAQLGGYAAASRLIDGLRLFPMALYGALFPALSALALDPAAMQAAFRRGALVLGAFGVGSALVLTVWGAPLLALLFGDGFAAAGASLALLAWALALGALRGLVTLYWYAHQRERGVNRVNAALVVIQLAAAPPLIAALGAAGAALTVLIVEGIGLAALGLGARRRAPAPNVVMR